MILRKRNILLQTAFIFITVMFANAFVDLLSDGNLNRMMGRPWLFFGGGLLLSFIGGFILAYVMEKPVDKNR